VDSNSQSLPNGDPSIVLSSKSESADSPTHFGESSERSANFKIGPNPVVIKTISEIKEQRLLKKVARLQTQRDYWKSKYDKLSHVLAIFPYSHAERSYAESKARSEKLKRLNEYDTMVPLLVSENERLKAQIQILTSISGAKD
jgi:hypothetical protein